MNTTTLTLRDVPNVTFPVFGLPSGTLRKADGLVFFSPEDRGELLLDDRNVSNKVFGLRRLKTPQRREKYNPRNCYRNLREFLNAKEKTFVDYEGRIFKYEKTLFCDIRYRKIKEVLRLETYSAVKVEGVKKAFEVPRPPPADVDYAGILYYHGHPWMIYDYSETLQKPRRRKV